MSKKYIAGISYSDSTAQVVVIRFTNNEPKIVYLEEWNKGENKDEAWFLDHILSKKVRWFKKVTKVALALENSSVVLLSFPMDLSLSKAEQQAHAQWELSNYIQQFQPKDRINDFHVLEAHPQDHASDMFIISARREQIYRTQQRLMQARFDLYLVEANHFGAQEALLINYPELRKGTVVLLSITRDRADIGILHSGKIAFYRYRIHPTIEQTAQLVSDVLQRSPSAALYAYGTGATSPLLKDLSERLSLPITPVNPFLKIPVRSWFRDFTMPEGQEHRFAACVGVALRKN